MTIVAYIGIFVVLLALELVYFKVADRYNIIDKPNERSSHSTIVLRGGGVIFALSMIAWAIMMVAMGKDIMPYLPFLCGLVLVAGISFVDDIHSLPDSLRMVVQIVATLLMFWNIGLYSVEVLGLSVEGQLWSYVLMGLIVIIALFFCVGATNIINFMDGINGITAAYALAMLIPLLIVDSLEFRVESLLKVAGFIEPSYLIVAILGVLVFSIFNFRPKGKAKCFAGDVGSISIAFIILFALGKLIVVTGDITYLGFFMVYGIDGSLTIFHRIMLHEKLGQAHRKHAYQLMANELGMNHVVVSLLYMLLQFIISLGFIYLCPNTVLAHWIYMVSAGMILGIVYIIFMKRYYHLHEAYLASLKS